MQIYIEVILQIIHFFLIKVVHEIKKKKKNK